MPDRRRPAFPSNIPADDEIDETLEGDASDWSTAFDRVHSSKETGQRGTQSLAPQEADGLVEILSPTARVEWLCDRHIVCYWVSGASRESYRLLFDRAEEIARTWPDDKPYLLIIDFLTGDAGVTPYAKERGRVLSKLRPDLPTMLSMLMPHSVVASFAQLAMRAFQSKTRAIAIHHSREDAVAWLTRSMHG